MFILYLQDNSLPADFVSDYHPDWLANNVHLPIYVCTIVYSIKVPRCFTSLAKFLKCKFMIPIYL